ncbi:chloride channel protein [Actinomycetospora sp. TBRC 11914]|uniref:chloride channel protein n=1 Tax=Actinomycetospora sp. TBRC 11914 TaxID=2729387 RepID=UPI00145FA5D8|nr:chloride channel protein [Actinomycetospora sp. TBRC 11914]NMO89514.1 chloride channel protein [Actinomycetospora sp. TBRC 11914]
MTDEQAPADEPGSPRRRPGRLGDFTVTLRVLLICAWAVPVGVVGAGAAWVLLRLIGLITQVVFFGRFSAELVSPGAAPHPWWLVLGAPVAGGLVVGVMARYGSERIRGHGMPEAIEAILTRGSRVEPKVAVLKPVSAAVSIGTGGPFGAEGPIIMTGGALGSILAQHLRLSADERKALMVAGAAAGMSATFNAPLASVLLAVELLLFEWRPRSFLPVATAVAVATLVRVPLLGGDPIFPVDTGSWHIGAGAEVLCVLAGAVGGLLAIVVTALVYLSEDGFTRLGSFRFRGRRLGLHWMWWPALGGVVIGLGGLVEPRALGVGYDVIDQLLTGRATLALIVGILVVKSLVWGLSLGSGTSGGVLAPVFMIGAALGGLEAHVLPGVGAGFWALVGLAAVVGGVMRSPLTGVVFSLELTHAWPALLPLLIASSAAYLVSALLLRRSVLTEKIARRGHHLSREYDVDPLEVVFVDEVMHAGPTVLAPGDALPVPAEVLASVVPRAGRDPVFPVAVPSAGAGGPDDAPSGIVVRQRLFPVVDAVGTFRGIVSRDQLVRADAGTVADLLTPSPVTVGPDDTLRTVRERFAAYAITAAPVVTACPDGPPRLVGIVTVEHLLDGRLADLAEEHHRTRIRTSVGGRDAAAEGTPGLLTGRRLIPRG